MEMSISETVWMVGFSCAFVVITYRRWCMNGKTSIHPVSTQRCVAHGSLISKESRDYYGLFFVTEKMQQPKITNTNNSGDPDSVSQYTVLRAMLVWAYAAGRRSMHVDTLTARASSACNAPMNIGMDSVKNGRKFNGTTNHLFCSMPSTST